MTWELWFGLYILIAVGVTVWSRSQRSGPYGWDRLELDDVGAGLIAPFIFALALVIVVLSLTVGVGAIIVSFAVMVVALFDGAQGVEKPKGGKKRKGRK